MAKGILRQIRAEIGRERTAEIEYGLKEFVQGLIIGIILGVLIAMQLI